MERHESRSWPEAEKEGPRAMTNVKNRRKHPRKSCALEAEYEVGGKEYSGLVADVSLGGMCLEARQKHEIGERVAVSILSDGAQTGLDLRGVVAYVLEADGCWRLGIEFDELNEITVEALALYLAT